MPFTINNVLVTFSIAEFDRLARECHPNINFGNSSLDSLRELLSRPPASILKQAVSLRISRMSHAKRTKYKRVIRYVAFHVAAISQGIVLNQVTNGRLTNRKSFLNYYATMDQTTEYVDLMYGIANARSYPPYIVPAGRPLQCDDYNNASNIGTGLAFGRQWNGTGFFDTTQRQATTSIQQGAIAPTLARREKTLVRSEATRQVFSTGLLNSRYNPTEVFRMSESRLKKDTHINFGVMRNREAAGAQGERTARKHYWAHAKMVKGVRRACKGGIAMVASSHLYRGVHAKVHFVLDGLGDLGTMARKDSLPNKDDYVAITSSELAFCCRYWDDPDFPLSEVVKFYVNGNRVYAPWEADWILQDATGSQVYSNQEAWLRYRYSAAQVNPLAKPFPRF